MPITLLLARVATAGFFMIHAISRIIYGTIPQFGQFMESLRFPAGEVLVWAITLTELVAGTLIILGRFVRPAAAALMAIAVGGIVLIHRHFGWFVGEHGTGGSEYSVALIVLLLLIMADDQDRVRNNAGLMP
ncbi:DoxX family protein [Sphingopyxis sp.]|uniref:DoxX family protein n=1 Tax=Sphingopyxis sp. TaxID=1908224 RepID=UPI003D10959A